MCLNCSNLQFFFSKSINLEVFFALVLKTQVIKFSSKTATLNFKTTHNQQKRQ